MSRHRTDSDQLHPLVRRCSFAAHAPLCSPQVTPTRFIATAPSRVDLAGGWTDVAPYTTEVGGAVCNVAIELRATAIVTATPSEEPPPEALMKAAWLAAGAPAVTISLTSAIPVGSGLGGSSAAGVALAAALAASRGERLTPDQLAERSRHTETVGMGLAGGCQDHFAAAYGGALLLTCGVQTRVSQIALSDRCTEEFEARAMIAFTGESRMSMNTINTVMNAYRESQPATCGALSAMSALAPQMKSALEAADIDALGALLALQWEAQRALHPTISTPVIDHIVHDCAAAGALGSKALGASGGGCVLVIARAGRPDAVRRALARHATILPLRVARTGVQLHITAGD